MDIGIMKTKTEKEIVALLAKYPAIPLTNSPFCSTYTINSRRVNEATLERMKEKGLVAIGVHPSSPGRTGFVVVSLPPSRESNGFLHTDERIEWDDENLIDNDGSPV